MLALFRLVIDGVSPTFQFITHIDFTYYSLVFLSLLILFVQLFIVMKAQKVKDSDDKSHKNKVELQLQKINNFAFYTLIAMLIMFVTYNFFR